MIAGSEELLGFEGIEPRIAADTGESTPSYLLVGRHGSLVRVSASAHRLLALAAKGLPAGRIAEELSAASPRPLTPAEIVDKVGELIETLRVAEARAARARLPPGFWLRLRLASDAWTRTLCRPFTWVFHPAAACLLLPGMAAAIGSLLAAPVPAATAGSFWPAYGLFFLSLLVHELGHAAACRRYGAQPGEIGITVYLVFPALYSDVSSAWRLRRWQRQVVDLAGAYTQLIVGVLYVCAYLAGAGSVFRTAFLMIVYTNLFSLNPVFKFDGYWLVADSLGVTNLSRQPARIARWMRDRLLRRRVPPLPWPPWIVAALTLYSLASIAVWGLFTWRLLPWLAARLALLPAQAASLAGGVMRGDGAAAGRSAWDLALSAGLIGIAVTALAPAVRAAARFLAARMQPADPPRHGPSSPAASVPRGRGSRR